MFCYSLYLIIGIVKMIEIENRVIQKLGYNSMAVELGLGVCEVIWHQQNSIV